MVLNACLAAPVVEVVEVHEIKTRLFRNADVSFFLLLVLAAFFLDYGLAHDLALS